MDLIRNCLGMSDGLMQCALSSMHALTPMTIVNPYIKMSNCEPERCNIIFMDQKKTFCLKKRPNCEPFSGQISYYFVRKRYCFDWDHTGLIFSHFDVYVMDSIRSACIVHNILCAASYLCVTIGLTAMVSRKRKRCTAPHATTT